MGTQNFLQHITILPHITACAHDPDHPNTAYAVLFSIDCFQTICCTPQLQSFLHSRIPNILLPTIDISGISNLARKLFIGFFTTSYFQYKSYSQTKTQEVNPVNTRKNNNNTNNNITWKPFIYPYLWLMPQICGFDSCM